jgi:hypothetical protein
MGQVVPFIARVRDSGDWSAAERARLEELADRLAASGVRVEVIFGATDEGDPWCVVTDEDGDVLIHVARIHGKFVVHSAVDDAVNESADLHTALRDRLAATEEAMAPSSATILPFGARQAQTFLALLAATAFFYETSAIGDTAEAGEPPPARPAAEPPPAPPPEAETPVHEREAAQGVALQPADPPAGVALISAAPAEAAPLAGAEPAPDLPPPPSPQPAQPASGEAAVSLASPTSAEVAAATIRGGAGNDLLEGTAADEHIIGGDGDDTLRGGGGHDLLDGGAGDDRLEITGQTVAIGGAGADTFVIQAPAHGGGPDTLLGVILDYSGAEGDRIFSFTGEAIRIPQQRPGDGTDKQGPPSTDGFAPQTQTPKPDVGPDISGGDFGTTTIPSTDHPSPAPPTFGPSTLGPATTTPLTRVDVDLDGDGVIDGYILVGSRGPITATVGAGLGGDPVG